MPPDFRNNGVRYAGDSLDLLFKYYNLNNCDEAKIYFTDLKIMLSPNESILSSEVLDQTMAKELAKIDPSMTDLLCSYLEKEICFYSYVRRASENLEHFKYDEIWESISKTSYLDEYE